MCVVCVHVCVNFVSSVCMCVVCVCYLSRVWCVCACVRELCFLRVHVYVAHGDCHVFLQVERDKFQKRQAEREAKFKEVMSELETQQATFKQMVKSGIARGGGSKKK
jgi:hypothetical protein